MKRKKQEEKKTGREKEMNKPLNLLTCVAKRMVPRNMYRSTIRMSDEI